MAPHIRYYCPCYKCRSKKLFTKRTIQGHFNKNTDHLNQLRASRAPQDLVDLVQDCHYQLTELLNSIAEESQSSRQSRSPNLDADASMAPQSILEDEMRDVDSMMVDDHDASFSLERESWDLELDPYNLEGLSDVEDDSSVIFDIPEETMGAPLGSGSESDPLEFWKTQMKTFLGLHLGVMMAVMMETC
ncbi:hypothetical protein V8E53_013394 [Lactarius tabidus]